MALAALLAGITAAMALPVGLALTPRATGPDRTFLAYWVGLLAIANALLGLSTLIALTPVVGLATAAIAAAAALSRSEVRREIARWRPRSRLATWGMLGAIPPLSNVVMYDTGLYHYQMVQWLAEHGTVPGLALVHGRFGFVSSWFALAAPFDFGSFEGRQSAVLSMLVLVPIALHLAAATERVLRRRGHPADVILIVGLALGATYAVRSPMGASLSPDLPLLFVPTIVAAALVRHWNTPVGSSVWVLASLAVPVKLSAAPLALGVGLWTVVARRQWRSFLAIGLAAALPLVAAFIVATGCVAYPVAPTCLGFSWGVPREAASQMSSLIRDWAMWQTSSPPQEAPPFGWFPGWFARRPFDGFADVAFAMSIGVALTAAAFRSSRRWMLWPAAIVWLGVVFAFAGGPDWRFMAGYIAAGIGVAGAMAWSQPAWLAVSRPAWTAVAWIPVAICLGALARGAAPVVAPSEIRQPPVLRQVTANQWSYRVPVGDDRCWAAELLCVPQRFSDGVRLRGDTLADGFTRSK